MENINDSYQKIDFFGEERNYSKAYFFNREWDIKLFSNSKEEAIECLKKMVEIFYKVDEIDFTDSDGHFISKEIIKHT